MKRIAALVAIVIIFNFTACGSGGEDEESSFTYDACNVIGAKIINGDQCDTGQAAVVELHLIDSFGFDSGLCTGTALTQYAVLTAAHCFIGDVEAVDIDTGSKVVEATDLAIHPGVRPTDDETAILHDLAIVITSEPLGVTPYPLLVSREVSAGEEVVIAGYGLDQNGDAETLRAGNARVETVTTDHIFYTYSGLGANTCQGDSGGPLLANQNGQFAIAGVTSSGTVVDCSEGDWSTYTNVANSSNAEFIFDIVPNAQGI